MFQIIARWHAQDGKQNEVLSLVKEMMAETRKEPGCKRYDVYINNEDSHAILLDELYDSAEAAQAHRDSPHFQNLVEGKISKLLASRSSEKRELEAK